MMIKKIIVSVCCVLLCLPLLAADPATTEAEQALEQLQFLQKSLAQNDQTLKQLQAKTQERPEQRQPQESVPAKFMPQVSGNVSNVGAHSAAVPPMPSATLPSEISPPVAQAASPEGSVPPPAGEAEPQASSSSDSEALFQTSNPDVDQAAFNSVTQRLFPLTPAQIIQLRQMYDTTERAQATPPAIPPKPTATSQFVNLAPGSTPPVVRLAQGFVSSLVFLDSTGAPWPIAAYDLGDPKAFNIQWDRTSNTLMIQANQQYNYGNLAIRLQGLNTPVMLTLIPGQKAVDYRVDMRVQGFGPNAKIMPAGRGLPPHADPVLLSVLDGVPPPQSSRLEVTGGAAEAWATGNKMFVRTHLTILSPGWIQSMTSADGMHVYEMQKAPVVLVSWQGKIMELKVEGL